MQRSLRGAVSGRWPMRRLLRPAHSHQPQQRSLRRLVRPGGSLVISGILAERHDHVLTALAPLTAVESLAHEGWMSIMLR